MLTAEKLKELRKKAQDAVADMPDGELKTKAFEVFLQHLLGSEPPRKPSEKGESTSRLSSTTKASKKPGSTKSRILLLKDEGFFAVPRSITDIKSELQAHGWILPMTTLSGPLQGLVQDRELRRIRDQGAKKKKVWKYVNP
ncbi:MAG: hypothetical protein HXY44_12140 [Syntrophaceae bacterium]|nr:hypothetical protein [Syntrophaceae bacterium]